MRLGMRARAFVKNDNVQICARESVHLRDAIAGAAHSALIAIPRSAPATNGKQAESLWPFEARIQAIHPFPARNRLSRGVLISLVMPVLGFTGLMPA